MAMNVSVVICTYNPRKAYLERVLDALKAQTLPQEQWELLLIDNASQEPLAERWDLSWHPNARHIREERVGKIHAISTAIREAKGGLFMTVDDDNVLQPDYLATTLVIHEKYPFLGVFGSGCLEPEFEVKPPKEVFPHVRMLALRKVSFGIWSNNPNDAMCIPWGAGFCATGKTVERYLKLIQQMGMGELLGPNGKSLNRGDDDLFTWAAVQTGQGFGVFPELQITHLISAGRLTKGYFLRLLEDREFSHKVLDYLLTGRSPHRQSRIRKFRILLNGIRTGSFAMHWQLAEGRGANRAADLIEQNRLKPIVLELGHLLDFYRGLHLSQ